MKDKFTNVNFLTIKQVQEWPKSIMYGKNRNTIMKYIKEGKLKSKRASNKSGVAHMICKKSLLELSK